MTGRSVSLGGRKVGPGHPIYVIAEIGINHNGSLDIARRLIDGAVLAGADAVKFQKRTPEVCVPRDQWELVRDTPWGKMTYIEYRHRVEFGEREYAIIDQHCRERNIHWFVSPWDEPSVDFIARFGVPCWKIASASITDHGLLRRVRAAGGPVIMSTGMSSMEEVEAAVEVLGTHDLLLAHSNSTYPCPVDQLNLKMLDTLRLRWPGVPVGYSGHEAGLAPTLAAVALGATFVERHVTLDRGMWGSDQAASLDVPGLVQLVSSIREVERSLGDGVKRLHEGELAARKKLRRVHLHQVPPLAPAPQPLAAGAAPAGASTKLRNGHAAAPAPDRVGGA